MEIIIDSILDLQELYYLFSRTPWFNNPSTYRPKFDEYHYELFDLPEIDTYEKVSDFLSRRIELRTNEDVMRLVYIVLKNFENELGGVFEVDGEEYAMDEASRFAPSLIEYLSAFDYSRLTEAHGVGEVDVGFRVMEIDDLYDGLRDDVRMYDLNLKAVDSIKGIDAYEHYNIHAHKAGDDLYGRIMDDLDEWNDGMERSDWYDDPFRSLASGGGRYLNIIVILEFINDWQRFSKLREIERGDIWIGKLRTLYGLFCTCYGMDGDPELFRRDILNLHPTINEVGIEYDVEFDGEETVDLPDTRRDRDIDLDERGSIDIVALYVLSSILHRVGMLDIEGELVYDGYEFLKYVDALVRYYVEIYERVRPERVDRIVNLPVLEKLDELEESIGESEEALEIVSSPYMFSFVHREMSALERTSASAIYNEEMRMMPLLREL